MEGISDSSSSGSRSFVKKRSVQPRMYSLGAMRLLRSALLRARAAEAAR
jgi:hypothetical protein